MGAHKKHKGFHKNGFFYVVLCCDGVTECVAGSVSLRLLGLFCQLDELVCMAELQSCMKQEKN